MVVYFLCGRGFLLGKRGGAVGGCRVALSGWLALLFLGFFSPRANYLSIYLSISEHDQSWGGSLPTKALGKIIYPHPYRASNPGFRERIQFPLCRPVRRLAILSSDLPEELIIERNAEHSFLLLFWTCWLLHSLGLGIRWRVGCDSSFISRSVREMGIETLGGVKSMEDTTRHDSVCEEDTRGRKGR